MIVELVVVWLVVAAIGYCTRAVARSVVTDAAGSDDQQDRPVRPHAGLVIDESEMVWTGLDDSQVERLLRDSAS